jgi:spore coat polysaccharide biosynthesis predicted glycosyltransferase SpsG
MTYCLNTYLLVTGGAWKSILLDLVRLVFRADASPELGSGHAMRCSAIAEEAIFQGIKCLVVGSLGGIKWLEEHYADIDCPVVPVEDFGKTQSGDVLILDSYQIMRDDRFITEFQWTARIDISDENTPERSPDLVIHPGLESGWFTGDRSKFLFGREFIPIRKTITKNLLKAPIDQNRVVVFGGGTDTYGFARIMGHELRDIPGFKQAIFFSVEKEFIENLDPRFSVLPFGAGLDEELSRANVVFTTASTSSLEVVARELPVGVACSVDNQIGYYQALGNSKVAAQIGERVTSGEWEMRADVIKRLITDERFQEELKSASHNFIDLKGAKRIVDAIISIGLGFSREPQHR